MMIINQYKQTPDNSGFMLQVEFTVVKISEKFIQKKYQSYNFVKNLLIS